MNSSDVFPRAFGTGTARSVGRVAPRWTYKPLGVPCVHLGSSCECVIYVTRPKVCRNYAPDWVCAEVAPLPTLEERTTRFLEIYGIAKP